VVDCVQRRENSSQLLDGGDFLETQVLGYLLDRALARHQHMLIMELVEHPQRRVRHHHLILIDLKNKFQFYKKTICYENCGKTNIEIAVITLYQRKQ
jgi:hypothetical protein